MTKEEQLVKIFGQEAVIKDKDTLAGFKSDSSFVSGEEPEFIIKPRRLDQIQELIKLANQEGFALIPRSSQGDRFRGDTVPSVPGAVIVDLSEMKSIIRIDQRNKVAMIEPGVKFGELQTEVEKAGLRLEMPMLPRKDKSVVASLLEREPTTGPKYNWDANDPLCCLELVFGTGDLFRTGNAAGPGSLEDQWAAGQAQKVPMGPAQTDIGRLIQGAQGSLAIASWATIKLEIMPTIRRGFVVRGQSLDELIDFAYKILWRKLPDLCLILNDADLSAITGIEAQKLAPWTLTYSISGLKHFPEERVQYLEKDTAEIAREFDVVPARSLAGISADQLIEVLSRPSEEPFWKLRPRGGCQDLFFLTTLDRSQEFIESMAEKTAEQGFPQQNLGTYIQPIRHGTGCHLEFNLFYEPGSRDERGKIEALMSEASKMCIEMGGFFSRPYGLWADMVYARCPDTVSALRKVKHIFDPAGVMNPGKLCFGRRPE
jgi:FAD/FMN-containing dehydrogenase